MALEYSKLNHLGGSLVKIASEVMTNVCHPFDVYKNKIRRILEYRNDQAQKKIIWEQFLQNPLLGSENTFKAIEERIRDINSHLRKCSPHISKQFLKQINTELKNAPQGFFISEKNGKARCMAAQIKEVSSAFFEFREKLILGINGDYKEFAALHKDNLSVSLKIIDYFLKEPFADTPESIWTLWDKYGIIKFFPAIKELPDDPK